MCISAEDRTRREFKYTNPNHVIQRFHERKGLFGNKCVDDMLIETQTCIRDINRCVIVPDERRDGNKSNYIAIFLTDFGELIAIPLFINETHIIILTLKDVKKDEKNPNWYINKYNEIGGTRGIQSLPLYYKTGFA